MKLIKWISKKIKKKQKHEVTVDELLSRNEKIRKIYEQQKQEESKKENKPKETCPNCGLKNASLVTCSVCGKKGCTECFTYNPEDRKYYCDDCW